MKTTKTILSLQRHGIQPSAHRLAVAEFVLYTDAHPSADEIWTKVLKGFPMISRATVYNTLNLFVKKGLLREWVLSERCVVFDPNIERHHHFIDEDSGEIEDVPWESIEVSNVGALKNYKISEYHVVLRGKRRR